MLTGGVALRRFEELRGYEKELKHRRRQVREES